MITAIASHPRYRAAPTHLTRIPAGEHALRVERIREFVTPIRGYDVTEAILSTAADLYVWSWVDPGVWPNYAAACLDRFLEASGGVGGHVRARIVERTTKKTGRLVRLATWERP